MPLVSHLSSAKWLHLSKPHSPHLQNENQDSIWVENERKTWWLQHVSQHLLRASLISVLVTQSCLTLCDPMDYSPPGSAVHGILQARILEWVAIPFSRDLPNPGIKPRSPALQADSLPLNHHGSPIESRGSFFVLGMLVIILTKLATGLSSPIRSSAIPYLLSQCWSHCPQQALLDHWRPHLHQQYLQPSFSSPFIHHSFSYINSHLFLKYIPYFCN